ncbi:MAG: ferritin family protein, partial [Bacteroidota bacterium]
MKNFENTNDILDFAIQNEQNAIDFYTDLAKNARNEEMKSIFEQFAKEEIGHKARLMKILTEQIFTMKEEIVADLHI